MGSVEEEKNFWSFKNPLSALRSERCKSKRDMGKCPYCPHGSSRPAASSRMSECTPDPFPFLGGSRTHTHRLGAHGGKQRRAQLEERGWRPASPGAIREAVHR